MKSLRDSCFDSNAIIESYYSKASALIISEENDSALTLLKLCDSLICVYKPTNPLSVNQYQLYNKLMLLTNEIEAEYFQYFIKALKFVCGDNKSLAGFLSKQDVILNDSLLLLFRKNFVKSDPDEPIESIYFKYIHFLDQFYRTADDINAKVDYSFVGKVDIILQEFFFNLSKYYNIEKKPAMESLFDSYALLLLHCAITPGEDGFFVENFHVFMSYLDYDFTEMSFSKHLLDRYLKESLGKQFFETGFGMSYSKSHGRVLLPKIEEEELVKVFEKLKMDCPKY